MAYNYSNLVFEGGGVKGIAYVGALQVLEQKGILANIKGVAGTSAGAIMSSLIALGYSVTDISNIMNNLDFSKFKDGESILELPFKYGLYKGDYFFKLMEGWVAGAPGKTLSKAATFADLAAAGGLDLHVFATDLNTQNAQEFCAATTPTVPVAEAVRASMSIPLFFRAWQFSNGNPTNHIYVDGGTVLNYPIDTFDSGSQPNMQTLGFFLADTSAPPAPSNLQFSEPVKYVKALFDTLLNSQEIDFSNDPSNEARSIKINDFGISATDFDLTNAQKQQLVTSGYTATINFLGN